MRWLRVPCVVTVCLGRDQWRATTRRHRGHMRNNCQSGAKSGGQHRPAASGPCGLPDKERQGGGLEANRDRLQLDAQQIACCLALWKGVVWLAQAHFRGGQCGVISLAAARPATSNQQLRRPLQPSFRPQAPARPNTAEHSTEQQVGGPRPRDPRPSVRPAGPLPHRFSRSAPLLPFSLPHPIALAFPPHDQSRPRLKHLS